MDEWFRPFVWFIAAAASVIAFIMRYAIGTRKSLSDHKVFAAEKFATKQDVNRGQDGIIATLTRIEQKLDAHISATGAK